MSDSNNDNRSGQDQHPAPPGRTLAELHGSMRKPGTAIHVVEQRLGDFGPDGTPGAKPSAVWRTMLNDAPAADDGSLTNAEVTYLLACIERDPRGLPSVAALRQKLTALLNHPTPEAENVAADAYFHACERMEHWQRKRAAEGKDFGPERSLCAGLEWLYRRVAELESGAPDR